MTEPEVKEPAPAARGLKDAAQDVQSGAPGGVSITNRMRRSAGAMFAGSVDMSGGTLIGRDQHNYSIHVGATIDITPQPVGTGERDELEKVFLPPANFRQAVLMHGKHRVLILRGPEGHGRGATAMRLLGEFGATELFRLPAGTNLARLRADQLTAGAGYLFTDLSNQDARSLTGGALNPVEAILASVDAYLVLTVSAQVRSGDPDVLDRTVDIGAPASGIAVLRRHLEHALGKADCDALLGDPATLTALTDLVEDSRGLRHAARVARLCVEERINGVLQLDSVRDRASQEDQADFCDWFDELPDDARAHAISLAVFHGLSYRVVADQAEALRRHVENPNLPAGVVIQADLNTVRRTGFGRSRTERLRELRAAVTKGTVPTLYGDVPTDVLAYRDGRYPEALLLRMRDEYPDIQRPMLDWLRNAGASSDDTVRIWAAEAVGYLARLDFTTVLNAVIVPWASSSDSDRQDAAAFTLEGPAGDGLRNQVMSVIRSWSDDDRMERRITAVRAYGASIGRTDPLLALTQLEQLIRDDNVDVALAAARSLADLIDFDPRLATQVLALLGRWIRSNNLNHKNAAELAFLLVASGTFAPREEVGEDDASVEWPLLLRLAQDDPELRKTIAGLWRTVLNGAFWNDSARLVLTQWAQNADPDRRPCSALARLALAIGTDPASPVVEARTRKILNLLVEQWAGNRPPHLAVAPRAASAVRQLIP